MGKKSIKIFLILLALAGCQTKKGRRAYEAELQRRADIAVEARIDSAYTAIQQQCDSLLQNRVSLLADSITNLTIDSITKGLIKWDYSPLY